MGITNLDLVSSAQNQELCIFLGAGVSIDEPTGLPHSGALCGKLLQSLCGDCFLSPKDKQAFLETADLLRLERLFSLLEIVLEEETYAPLRLFSQAPPNQNHRHIAALAAQHCIAAVFTTNFDTAFEKALEQYGVPYTVYVTESDYAEFNFCTDSLPVFKLHGSVTCRGDNKDDFMVTMEQVGKPLSLCKSAVLEHYLKTQDFMFLGYSGCDDFDIYPLLYNTVSNKKLLWVCHTPNISHFFEISGDAWKSQAVDKVGRLIVKKGANAVMIEKHTAMYLDSFRSLVLHEFGVTNKPKVSASNGGGWNKAVASWAIRYKNTEVPFIIKAVIEGIVFSNAFITIENLMKALEISIYKNSMRSRILTQTLLGIHLTSLGEYEKSLSTLQEAYALSAKHGFKRLHSNVANELAYLYTDLGQFEKVIDVASEALDGIDEKEQSLEYGLLLHNLGQVYYRMRDYKKALSYWERSASARRANGDVSGLTVTLFNLGQLYMDCNKPAKATACITEGLIVESKISIIDINGSGRAFRLLYYLFYSQSTSFDRTKILNQLNQNGLHEIALLLSAAI